MRVPGALSFLHSEPIEARHSLAAAAAATTTTTTTTTTSIKHISVSHLGCCIPQDPVLQRSDGLTPWHLRSFDGFG